MLSKLFLSIVPLGATGTSMKIRRIGIAFWIPKATNTCSEYVLHFHCNNDCTYAPQLKVFTYIVLLELPFCGVNLAAAIYQTKFPLL